MKWQKVDKQEVSLWNEKLKQTKASFFQYPYYASGYRYFFLSRAVYLKLIDNNDGELAYCCILTIGIFKFKVGLIIRGPVLMKNNFNVTEAIQKLKQFVADDGYIFIRINPDEQQLEDILKADNDFINKDYFPSYKGSQLTDFVVYNKPFSELLTGFRTDCRNKIRYAKEKSYIFSTVKNRKELKEVYFLFKKLGKAKKFTYRPFKSYSRIFEEGSKHNLCSVYKVEADQGLISSVFIVKDAETFTNFSGALMLNGIQPKYSPANTLHYLIMQDCFYKENKQKYNLSYSSPGSGTHMFKASFKPEEETKPGFYTYLIKRKYAETVFQLQKGSLFKIRRRLRWTVRLLNK